MAETKKKKTSHANRGLKFEEKIQNKCDKLKEQGIMLISKVPTEFKMIRNGGRVVSAFPVSDSRFVDFCGCTNTGKAIGIEAKETSEDKRFPLQNIKLTQLEFFRIWNELNGLGYYLIHWKQYKEVYFIKSTDMQEVINNINRKSIPYNMFKEDDRFILLDYDELNFEDYI